MIEPDRIARTILFCALLLIIAACGKSEDPAEIFARGKSLLDSGDVASAVIELKNAVQAAPEDAVARATLGQAYLVAGDASSALKEFLRARSLGDTGDALNRGVTKAMIMSGAVEEAATELALNSKDNDAEWLTLQGLLDLGVGRFEEARAEFERALALNPDIVEARRASVRAAIGLGETAAAREEVEKALKLTQDDFDIWILKGDLDRHDKKFDEAIVAYTRALEIVPDSPLALLQRSGARVASSDFDGALGDLDAIGDASNEDPRAVYLRALIARERGQEITALRYLRQILVVIPDHRPSLVQAATIHFDANEFSQADEYVERLLAIDPANLEYQRMRGAVQLAAGRLDTRLGDMENIELDDYSDPTLLALLGTAYMRHGKLAEGTRSLERAKELNPDSVPIRTQLAFSRMRAGKIDEALRELEGVRADDPEFMLAAVLQAFGYASMKEKDRALAIADELVTANPGAAVAWNLRGYLYAAYDDVDTAKDNFERAADVDPEFSPAYFNLARLAIKRTDTAAAEAFLQKVLDRDPNDAQALLYVASLRLREGERDAAVLLWRKSSENNPDAIEPRVFLARHYRQSGDADSAMQYAEAAYELGSYLPAAQFEFATLKLFKRDQKAAMPAIDALVARFPDAPVPLELKARAQEMNGDIGSLKKTLTRLIEISPDSPKPRVAMVRLYLSRQEFDEALKEVEVLRESEKFVAVASALEGDIRFAQGEMKLAAKAYAQAHELNPTSQSLLKMNAVERRLGAAGDAKLDQWLSENPDDANVRVVKATSELVAGDRSAAIENYEKVLKAEPNNVVALNNLAWLFDEQGDERSIEYARRAYELAPGRPEVMDTYGWALLRSGKLEQALGVLGKAAAAAEGNPDIGFHFASALAESGDKEEALAQLDAILDGDTEFPSRAEAQTLLQSLRP